MAVFVFSLMFGYVLVVATPLTGRVYAFSAADRLTEWTVPTANSVPTSLTLDPAGNCCWFLEYTGNKVAHLDPSTNLFREWTIPTASSSPTGMAITSVSGSLVIFGTEFTANKVFLFWPGNNTFKEYTLPTADSGPEYVGIEPMAERIRVWFTELGGPSNSYTRNSIGEIVYNYETHGSSFYEWTIPAAAGGGANGVFAGSGVIWFAGFTAIVKWDRAASQFTTWSIPSHPSATGGFVKVDSLGQVWYTSRSAGASSTENYVGVLRGDNTFKEWQVPTAGADLRILSLSPTTQNPWVAEQGANKIAELDPSAGGVVTGPVAPATTPFTPVPGAPAVSVTGPVLPSTATVAPTTGTNAGSVTGQFKEWTLAAGSHPHDVVVDASGNVWTLESSINKVAKLTTATPDFGITCNPLTVSMAQGASGTSTCTVTSLNAFNSAVDLTGSWVGSAPSGVSHTLPTPITPPSGGNATSNLSIGADATASTGPFTFRVTGVSGSLAHAVDLTVQITAGVADFTVTVDPASLSLGPGGSGTSTVTVHSAGTFSAPVTLTTSGAPGGLNLVFGTNPVTPPAGGTAASVLSVIVSGAPTGAHTVTITGTSGTVTRNTTLTVTVVGGGGGCLIATATYGSELSDEVLFLRSFRDGSILKTNAGSSFMTVFNAWYYSFSPAVAQLIREHSLLRTALKFTLYPLMGILRAGAAIFDLLPGNVEAAAVASGLVVSALIGVIYVALPLTVVLACSQRVRRLARRVQLPVAFILVGALVAVAIVIYTGAPAILMMVATSTIVLASLTSSALLTRQAILHIRKRL